MPPNAGYIDRAFRVVVVDAGEFEEHEGHHVNNKSADLALVKRHQSVCGQVIGDHARETPDGRQLEPVWELTCEEGSVSVRRAGAHGWAECMEQTRHGIAGRTTRS